jgi:hypothetical protein
MLCVTVRFNPAYSKGLLTDRREPTSTLWLRNRARNGSDLPHFRYVAGRRVRLLPPNQRTHEKRSTLAVRILKLAAKGERNPTRLHTYALMETAGRHRNQERVDRPTRWRLQIVWSAKAPDSPAGSHQRGTAFVNLEAPPIFQQAARCSHWLCIRSDEPCNFGSDDSIAMIRVMLRRLTRPSLCT